MITALAYLGIRSDKAEDWRSFAGNFLGMQLIDNGGRNNAFRMDDHYQRLIVSDEPGDTISYIGWEVAKKSSLDAVASKLEASGYFVKLGNREDAHQRYVSNLIYCIDPDGHRIEFVWSPMKTEDPFIPGRPIDGFKTGPFGMGHVVLHVRDAKQSIKFYRDILGFRVSDYGLKPTPIYFFHVNGRHHSFAVVETGRVGFHHFMVEYDNLDDVGQGYDLANIGAAKIAYTLGRHTNDYMTSFYSFSPSGFFVESGWGGRIIDPFDWKPHETTVGPSFWGHERLYLDETERKAFRNLRHASASRGCRAPPIIDCPWLYNKISK